MINFAKDLISAKRALDSGVASVTISIPLDSPIADRLADLARRLLVPTTTIKQSGLITKTGIDNQSSTAAFLMALRAEFGNELIDELERDLNAQIELEKRKRAADLLAPVSNDDRLLGNMIQDGLSDSRFRGKLTSSNVAKLHNLSEKMKQDNHG